MEDPKTIAEIVTPNVVRVGGVLFHRMPEGHADETATFEYSRPAKGLKRERITVHHMECSHCGRSYEHVNGDYERCPHCGAVFKEEVDPDEEGRG